LVRPVKLTYIVVDAGGNGAVIVFLITVMLILFPFCSYFGTGLGLLITDNGNVDTEQKHEYEALP